MKSKLICLFLLLAGAIDSQAQSFSDVFEDQTEIVWLGLDFSEVRVICANNDKEEWRAIKPQELYVACNQLMIDEAKKFNIGEALDKKNVKMAIDVAMEHNRNLKVDEATLLKDAPSAANFLNVEKIKNIVTSYDFKENKGIGFLIVMETLDKLRDTPQGSMWLVFINLNTKEVLFAQQMATIPMGFGLRNFWSSCVYYALKKVKGVEYRNWSKTYRKKK